MLENLTREQLLVILQDVVRYCTFTEKYHTEENEKIEDELHANPDEETFQKLLRSRRWNNGGLSTAQEVLHLVKDFSDAYNANN